VVVLLMVLALVSFVGTSSYDPFTALVGAVRRLEVGRRTGCDHEEEDDDDDDVGGAIGYANWADCIGL
jgi:hypothetical protein